MGAELEGPQTSEFWSWEHSWAVSSLCAIMWGAEVMGLSSGQE